MALQGAVREHLLALRRCAGHVGQELASCPTPMPPPASLEAHPVRTAEEVAACDALIIPGGESTTIGKLMDRYRVTEAIKHLAASGRPLLGTCAGMILMAKAIEAGAKGQAGLELMDITVERNAFGRQVDSFEADLEFHGVNGGPVRAVFIRAPVIKALGRGVEALATHEGRVVAARQGNLLALAFHPELTGDPRIHQYFLSMQ